LRYFDLRETVKFPDIGFHLSWLNKLDLTDCYGVEQFFDDWTSWMDNDYILLRHLKTSIMNGEKLGRFLRECPQIENLHITMLTKERVYQNGEEIKPGPDKILVDVWAIAERLRCFSFDVDRFDHGDIYVDARVLDHLLTLCRENLEQLSFAVPPDILYPEDLRRRNHLNPKSL